LSQVCDCFLPFIWAKHGGIEFGFAPWWIKGPKQGKADGCSLYPPLCTILDNSFILIPICPFLLAFWMDNPQLTNHIRQNKNKNGVINFPVQFFIFKRRVIGDVEDITSFTRNMLWIGLVFFLIKKIFRSC
jgi:hypothetical protein